MRAEKINTIQKTMTGFLSHLDQIFFVEVCHIESILQSLVDEGGRVVPRHRLLQQQGFGQDLLGAETAGSQLPLHGSQDLKYQLLVEVKVERITLLNLPVEEWRYNKFGP